MGLALGGVACTRRGSWVWAGVLLGLAITSSSSPSWCWLPFSSWRLLVRKFDSVAGQSGPLRRSHFRWSRSLLGRVLGAELIGSGNTPSIGGTVVWELHLRGVTLIGFSRVLPIVLSMALASWALRRLGSAVLEPVPLLALVATSLSFRLVFEQNLFGYYFMALAVSLALMDILGGRIRLQLVA